MQNYKLCPMYVSTELLKSVEKLLHFFWCDLKKSEQQNVSNAE